MNSLSETWLPVAGPYGAVYQVSDQGQVRRTTTGRLLKPIRQAGTGHYAVNLSHHSRSTTHLIASLVTAAFLGPRPAQTRIARHDGDPANYALSNLSYAPRKAEPANAAA